MIGSGTAADPSAEDLAVGEVVAAAHAYEDALAAGDTDAATSFFDDDARTSRFGPDGSQLDLEAVRWLRASSAPVPVATWQHEQARLLAPDVVLHVAVLERGGATIQRTQVWVCRSSVWRIAHAHVSALSGP